MLTRVDLTNVRSDTLSLALADASNGYAVREIQGLDPVNASLTSSTMAQLDGAQPQNARRDTRNITMKIGLTPDYITSTVDSLRQSLYDYLMPKALVNLGLYKDESLYAITSGQVETFENNMFSSDPEVDISIICYDPDLYAPAAITANDNTTTTTSTTAYNYLGSSDTGVIFTLNVNRALSGFSLYNTSSDNSSQVFTMTGSFISGDVITVNSIPGKKAVTLTRNALTTSALSYVDPTSSWVLFKRGVNLFRAVTDSPVIPYTLTYTPKYGGF